MLRLLGTFLWIGLLSGSATARAEGSFEVPCQSREAFVSRLRALVQQPAAADAALRQFDVTARELGPRDWLLLVRRQADESAPRSVRDTSCEAVTEAAALVTALWIDEVSSREPAPPAVPHLIVNEAPEEYTVGVSFLADASRVFHTPVAGGLGTSALIWIQNMSLVSAHLGLRSWPTQLRLPVTSDNVLEQRGPVEFLIGVGAQLGRWDFFSLGVQLTAVIGSRRTDNGTAVAPRGDLALVTRFQLARAYFIRGQVGLSLWDHPQRAALIGALGLDILAFDL